ncbi:MAG: serine/threonine dehydratase [Chloroflexota bacterium]
MSEGHLAPVQPSDVAAAAERIAPYIRHTPTMPLGKTLRTAFPFELVLKLENLQVTGSFKARGALNAILTSPEHSLERGVVTASGGNHGLGVAYAARAVGVPATVFVPVTAPAVKRERIAEWGAEVRTVGREYAEAAEAAMAEARTTGRRYVHAYADPAVIAGQGTVTKELCEDAGGALDYIVIAVGGGGLIGGAAAYTLEMPWITLLGVEPFGAATLHAALAAGGPVDLGHIDSIAADALGARRVGDVNYDLARRRVARVELVADGDIRRAQYLLWDEVQTVAEPGGAAALAALISGAAKIPEGARVGVLVCGGNTGSLPTP